MTSRTRLQRRAKGTNEEGGAIPGGEFIALVPGWILVRIQAAGAEQRLPPIPASGSALGSLSSVALSSVRLTESVSIGREMSAPTAPIRLDSSLTAVALS